MKITLIEQAILKRIASCAEHFKIAATIANPDFFTTKRLVDGLIADSNIVVWYTGTTIDSSSDQTSWHNKARWEILVTAKSIHEACNLVEFVQNSLAGQDLSGELADGLEIQPIDPVQISKVSTEEFTDANITAYSLFISVGFDTNIQIWPFDAVAPESGLVEREITTIAYTISLGNDQTPILKSTITTTEPTDA